MNSIEAVENPTDGHTNHDESLEVAELQTQIADLEREKTELAKKLEFKDKIIGNLNKLGEHWKNECYQVASNNAALRSKIEAYRRGEKRSYSGKILPVQNLQLDEKPTGGESTLQTLNGLSINTNIKANVAQLRDHSAAPKSRTQNSPEKHKHQSNSGFAATTLQPIPSNGNDKALLEPEVEKCKMMFVHVLRVSKQLGGINEIFVKNLCQDMINGTIKEGDFESALRQAVKSLNNVKPGVISQFLKSNFPKMKKALTSGQIYIEGISPPASANEPDFASLTASKLFPGEDNSLYSDLEEYALEELPSSEMQLFD